MKAEENAVPEPSQGNTADLATRQPQSSRCLPHTVFMRDPESRLAHSVQLTTDGHKMYLGAVWDAFRDRGGLCSTH